MKKSKAKSIIFYITKNSVLYSWLFSYFVVLLMPIILSLVMYSYSHSSIKAQIVNYNALLINIIMKEADRLVEESMTINNLASLNSVMSRSLNIKQPLDNTAYFTFYEIQDMLTNYMQTTKSASEIYVYLEQANVIVSMAQTFTPEAFYNRQYSGSLTSYEEWMSYLSQRNDPYLRNIRYEGKQDILLCMKNLSSPVNDQNTGKIVTQIQTMHLDELVSENNMPSEYAILDKNSPLIASTKVKNMDFSEFLTNEDPNNDILHLKNEYFYQFKTSQLTGITYIALMDSGIFYRELNVLQRVCLILIVITLIMVSFLVFIMLRRNYMPLKLMLDKVKASEFTGENKNTNEYDLIKKAIDKMENENIANKIQLEAQNEHVQTSVLNRLLKGSLLESEQSIKEMLKECGIVFPGDHFAVIVFQPKDFSELFKDDSNTTVNNQYKTVRYVIKNVTEELSHANGNSGYLCDMDETLALVLSIAGKNRQNAQQQISKLAEFTQKFFLESLKITLSISVSNVHKSVHGINIAYNEAVSAIDYNLILGDEEIIDAGKLSKTVNDDYCFSFEKEQLLINYIKTGNIEDCKTLLDELFYLSFKSNVPLLDFARCIAFDMVGTIMKLRNEMTEIDRDRLLDISSIVQRLFSWKNVDALKESLMEVIEVFCKFYESRNNIKLKQMVMEIIMENYNNPDLSVGFIADILNINRSYLSTSFKDQAHEGLLEYINRYRIEQAKQMLMDTTLGIEQIAEKIGYTNPKALIRIFKKYEGITPTQYRKSDI